MGWLCLIAIQEMMEKIPEFSLLFIVVGGGFYMLGIIFYLWEKLPYNHAIWQGKIAVQSCYLAPFCNRRMCQPLRCSH